MKEVSIEELVAFLNGKSAKAMGPVATEPNTADGTPRDDGPCEGCDCGKAEEAFDQALAAELNDLNGADLETVINVLASTIMSLAKSVDMPHTAAAAFQVWINNKE